jgi:hypothetical protein
LSHHFGFRALANPPRGGSRESVAIDFNRSILYSQFTSSHHAEYVFMKYRAFAAASAALFSLLVSFSFPLRAATTNVNLINITNSWHFEQSGFDLADIWTLTNYDDSLWASGRQLFYNTTAAMPAPTNTHLNLGASTYYFRKHFNVNATGGSISLRVGTVLDDGAVVYLNGAEVLRVGMPDGFISYQTLANRRVVNAAVEGPFTIPNTALIPGENLIAVEVHQADLNDPDVVFGLSLNATVTSSATPRMQLRLNEILSRSVTVTNSAGRTTDFIEIYNPTAAAIDLSDMSLSDDPGNPRKWAFPSGTVIDAKGFYAIESDGSRPASDSNTGFSLSGSEASVIFYDRPDNGGLVVDSVSYGLMVADYSIGRVPDGTGAWVLTKPTATLANTAAALGNSANLKINEWLADNSSGDDWLELYNSSALPVKLSGLYFSNASTNFLLSPIPPLCFIGTGNDAFIKFDADKDPQKGPDHVDFKLKAGGGSIYLSDGTATVLTSVNYPAQQPDISQGRLPDGAPSLATFTQPTPGKSNFLPLSNVVLNEILTHTDPPLEDAVELLNPTANAVSIGGWYISNSDENFKKFKIPAGTTIQPGGLVVFYENQFNGGVGSSVPFTFNSAHGDGFIISATDVNGNLNGFRLQTSFDAAANGISFGRVPTSVGSAFVALRFPTFGVTNPASVADFRLGRGAANAPALVGPLVINEIMYQPPLIIIGTNVVDDVLNEYVELKNITTTNLPLFDPGAISNRWRISGGVDFVFPSNSVASAGGYLLLVNFDPATNNAAVEAFRAKYNVAPNVPLFGPYSGKLGNSGDSISIFRPDPPQLPPHPDAGFVPYVLIDRVVYSATLPWPTNCAATGNSLQKRGGGLFGNDPASWRGAAPNPGKANAGIIDPPVIYGQPESQSTQVGADVEFRVQVNGTLPLFYQWRAGFAGGDLIGETNSTLTLRNVSATNAGNFRVIITNSAGVTTSEVAVLSVFSAPEIVTQPQSHSVHATATTTLSVQVSGSPSPDYHWYFRDMDHLVGTGSLLVIPNFGAANEGNYFVVSSNSFGFAQSNPALLLLDSPLRGLPPLITPDGSLLLQLAGPPGSNYVLETSVDLKTWTPVLTNAASTGVFTFSDESVKTNPKRFYRIHAK